MKNKIEKRIELKKARMQRDIDCVRQNGKIICEKIASMPEYKEAEEVYSYMPIRNEADVTFLMDIVYRDKKKLLLPRVTDENNMEFYHITKKSQLCEGYMGISEPIKNLMPFKSSHKGVSIMLVPGVAFDKNGGRIGMGKGYYDRYISKNHIGTLIGVCEEYQMVKEGIPMEAHDIYMDYIVSEKNLYKCR